MPELVIFCIQVATFHRRLLFCFRKVKFLTSFVCKFECDFLKVQMREEARTLFWVVQMPIPVIFCGESFC